MDGEKKQTTDLTLKNQEIISFFEKDHGFVFAYKKTEKLASAIYMVTNLFGDNEPMKWALRRKVADLLSHIVAYKDIKDSAMSDFVYTTKTLVLEIISMLEITMRAGLVSNMNFSVLKSEFSMLIEVIDSESSKPRESSQQSIGASFFDVKSSQYFGKEGHQSPASHRQDFAPSLKDVNPLVSKDEFKRSNRQNIILGLIKKKKELTIKDIALVIKDCSEKTIQRELISFIQAGVLKRTGERRWSKYSLA